MGVFIKNDLEKILSEAQKKATVADREDTTSSYGERMRDQLATMMGRDKAYGQHIEGTISGGSFVLSPLNRLTKKGRAFEKTMDEQGSEEYNKQFISVHHKQRPREDHERRPDHPMFEGQYDFDKDEYIQDVRVETERGKFATHRGKNDVVVDLVMTGRVYRAGLDEHGNQRKYAVDIGLTGMTPPQVETGQYVEREKNGEKYQIPVTEDSADAFQSELARRVAAAKEINDARLKELGYELLERGDDGYVKQQIEIDNDPRFIETYPDLTDMPVIEDNDGNAYGVEYDVVIHINGQKVQPQDMDLAFQQLSRKGAYEKPRLEAGRDFLVQQGVRGAAFHASVMPQQAVKGAIAAPGKLSREAQQAISGTVLKQILNALSMGISR